MKLLIPALAAGAIFFAPSGRPGTDSAAPPPAEPAPPGAQYGRVPPHFIRNDGQLAEEVGYYLKGPRGTVYLTGDEVVFDFLSGQAEPPDRPSPPGEEEETTVSRLVFRLRFSDPDPEAALEGAKELPGKINYFIGDRENWRTSIPTYREVVYRGIYPGINLVCRLEGANIRYRCTVSPGADPGRIKFSYSGVDGLEINPDGDLIVLTPFGGFRTPTPRLRQEIDGEPVEIDGAFVIPDDLTVTLKIAPYDRALPLIIDF
ncbi:MAG: hypothetical protein P9M08_01210 [Candidatus Erginobacter occultus]|nr:hypothetical protein [Candidatus Erginobacter occultus]